MTKKQNEAKKKILSPGSYWEYRCTIEELKCAKLNKRRVNLEQELMNKEIENRKLKLSLFRETIVSAHKSVEN